MEVKLAGFTEAINESVDKKNTSSQDEFNELFSVLFSNMLQGINNQQIESNTVAQDNSSGPLKNINFVSMNKNDMNEIQDLMKNDMGELESLMKNNPDLLALINDFKSLVSKDTAKGLKNDSSGLDSIVNDLGELVETEDNTSVIKKLNSIIDAFENRASNLNEKSPMTKFNHIFNLGKEVGLESKIDQPFKVAQNLETAANMEPVNNPGLENKNFDLNNKDTSPCNMVDQQVKNISSISSNTVSAVEAGKNSLEITKFITKPEDLVEVAVEKFKSLRLPDRTELNVKLRPEELGEITVKLVLEKGQVNGNILAENKDVVNMLKAQIDGLKQELRNNNVNLTSLNVNVSSDNLFNNGRGGKEFSQNNSNSSRSYEDFEDFTTDQEEEGFTIMA